jgi:hypothetical protein
VKGSGAHGRITHHRIRHFFACRPHDRVWDVETSRIGSSRVPVMREYPRGNGVVAILIRKSPDLGTVRSTDPHFVATWSRKTSRRAVAEPQSRRPSRQDNLAVIARSTGRSLFAMQPKGVRLALGGWRHLIFAGAHSEKETVLPSCPREAPHVPVPLRWNGKKPFRPPRLTNLILVALR